MDSIYILAVMIVGVAVARPQEPLLGRGTIPVLARTEVRDHVGQFSLNYLSGDGITFTEQGRVLDGKDRDVVKSGSYSYTAPDGQVITLTYG